MSKNIPTGIGSIQKKTYLDTVQLPGRVLDAQKTHGTEIQGPELFLNSILLQTNTVRNRNTRARAVPIFYSIYSLIQ